jgi:hypothetical protein
MKKMYKEKIYEKVKICANKLRVHRNKMVFIM